LIRNFNNRDREQFFTPSKELFSDFCQSLVDRHGLDELIEKGRVRDVIPLKQGSETIFRIEYVYQGVVKVVFSKRVVLAVGNSNNPKIPDWISTENMNELNVFHSMDLIKDGFVESLNPKDKILVVGGGLTSAQLARKATVEGYQKVCFMLK
jgi:lysine/ornithine N-monooxygenase